MKGLRKFNQLARTHSLASSQTRSNPISDKIDRYATNEQICDIVTNRFYVSRRAYYCISRERHDDRTCLRIKALKCGH